MTEIRFSQPVIDLAVEIYRKYSLYPLPTGVLHAIGWLDYYCEIVANLRQLEGCYVKSIAKNEATVRELELLLSRHGVTNDRTADLYIKMQDIKLGRYLVRYRDMQERHRQELARLVETFI